MNLISLFTEGSNKNPKQLSKFISITFHNVRVKVPPILGQTNVSHPVKLITNLV